MLKSLWDELLPQCVFMDCSASLLRAGLSMCNVYSGGQDMSLNSSSFWSYGRPSLDYSHILRKNQYQLASRSPQSHKSRTDDTDNLGEEVSVCTSQIGA